MAAAVYLSGVKEHEAEIRVAQAQYMRDRGGASHPSALTAFILAAILSVLGLYHFL